MCNDLERFERRPLPLIRPVGALATLATLSAGILNLDGEKICFYALVSASTASGKEAIQRYIKSMFTALGVESRLCPEPRSDKNVMLDLADNEAIVYILDEAHTLFRKALSQSRSRSFESSIGDLLMELKTTSYYKFPRSVVFQISNEFKNEIKRLAKTKTVDNEHQIKVAALKQKIERVKKGLQNPLINFVGFSTPKNISFVTDVSTIESGFVGRLCLFMGDLDRAKLKNKRNRKVASMPSKELIIRCENMVKDTKPIVLASNCETLLDDIIDYFEDDSRLNHEQLGGIYARATENIVNLASLLALESRVIESEMLLYATKLFMENVRVSEEALLQHKKSLEQIELHSASRVAKRMTKTEPKTLGVLANSFQKCDSNIRKKIKNGNERAAYVPLETLIKQGVLISQDGKLIHSLNLPK